VIPWRFALFCAGIGLIVYLHFYFSHRQWRRVRGEVPSDVDPTYVKREDYFAQSFRSKVRDWLNLPSLDGPLGGPRTVLKERETIRVVPELQMEPGAGSSDILVVEGDFRCGPGCALSREIYARGKAAIGAGSQIQAIAADQNVELGDKVTVARWVDSLGELRIGRACVVHSRATAQTIRLAMDAEVQSVFAPLIESDPDPSAQEHAYLPFVVQSLQIPLADAQSAASWKKLGFDNSKLIRLDADSWIYHGSLKPRVPLRLAAKLVVKGDCVCPPGSVLEQDLKTTGRLAVGDGSECRGNLVAGKSLYLGLQVRFSGILHSGAALWLSRGVHGEAGGGNFVAAHAGSSLYMEAGVTVHGKLSGGKHVKVVPASYAEKWRRRYEFSSEKT